MVVVVRTETKRVIPEVRVRNTMTVWQVIGIIGVRRITQRVVLAKRLFRRGGYVDIISIVAVRSLHVGQVCSFLILDSASASAFLLFHKGKLTCSCPAGQHQTRASTWQATSFAKSAFLY